MPDSGGVCIGRSCGNFLLLLEILSKHTDAIMEEIIYREPIRKRAGSNTDYEYEETNTSLKRPRTKEDFMEFCSAILAYSQYESYHNEDLRQENNMSPVDTDSATSMSEFSSSASFTSDSEQSPVGCSSEAGRAATVLPTSDQCDKINHPPSFLPITEDSSLVTCFCMKPYANRPMIECSECLSWIHFSCAKIRKTNIPDTFVCQPCRDAKYTVRKSDRRRMGRKRLTI